MDAAGDLDHLADHQRVGVQPPGDVDVDLQLAEVLAGLGVYRVPVDPPQARRRLAALCGAADAAFLLVKTRSGALGSLEATRLATGAQDEFRFEVHGTRGALRFNLMDPNWLEVYDATDRDAGWTRLPTVQRYPGSGGLVAPKASIGWVRAHVACLHHFLAAVAEGRPAEPGLDTGARVQHIMDAAYRSAETGAWVSV